jgi:hypothetical protein
MREALTCENRGLQLVLKEDKIAEIPCFIVDSHKTPFIAGISGRFVRLIFVRLIFSILMSTPMTSSIYPLRL